MDISMGGRPGSGSKSMLGGGCRETEGRGEERGRRRGWRRTKEGYKKIIN